MLRKRCLSFARIQARVVRTREKQLFSRSFASKRSTESPRILVTGSSGQIGFELVPALRRKFGAQNVVAADVNRPKAETEEHRNGPFMFCDVRDKENMRRLIVEERIDWLVHLAAILSAQAETIPETAININNHGTENALSLAYAHNLRIFTPASIAVFGPDTPKHAPNVTLLNPSTIYGIGKVYLEMLGKYYHDKMGVDFRSLRYPGMVSFKTPPGGGSTGYAVAMLHAAVTGGHYVCPLRATTELPMMYIDDCTRGTMHLICTDDESALKSRTYNMAAMSFSPQMLASCIRQYVPDFVVDYEPDSRDDIARSWVDSMDDSAAFEEWGWVPEYDLDATVRTMLFHLHKQYQIKAPIAGIHTDTDSKKKVQWATSKAGVRQDSAKEQLAL